MREHPILFSGPMIRALLAGTKTQTRRVSKWQPHLIGHTWMGTQASTAWSIGYINKTHAVWNERDLDGCLSYMLEKNPYGQRGDRLWVRETWTPVEVTTSTVRFFDAKKMAPDKKGMMAYYAADYPSDGAAQRWKPSIHMPRWASRLTLGITEVRVQRLQDISEEDAMAEGIKLDPQLLDRIPAPATPAKDAFKRLWDSINGKRPGCNWEANPWVWAVSFKRVKP